MSNMVINVIHKPISPASQHAQISPMSGITESGQMTTCVAWFVWGVQELRGRDPGTLERVLGGDSTHGMPSPGRGDDAGSVLSAGAQQSPHLWRGDWV